MSRLTALTLALFRSHRRLSLRLDGRPVVLFGANGAGKTNVLEAISLLAPGRGLRRAAAEDLARRPESVGWKIRAQFPSHEVEVQSEGAARLVRIDGKLSTQAGLGRVARMLWLTPAMDRLWIEAPEGRRRFLDRLALSFFPGHAEAAASYERAMRERNRLLRDAIDDAGWFTALEARMAEAGILLEEQRAATVARLHAALDDAVLEAPDVAAAFPVPRLSIENPEPWGELADALRRSRGRDRLAGRTLLGPHRADLAAVWPKKNMSAAQCSTGEQKALLLSLVLANARALRTDTGAPPILLLDEVAAHLDPSRRRLLHDALCALEVQAFLTGTEAALFDDLGARAQCFEVRDTGDSAGSQVEEII